MTRHFTTFGGLLTMPLQQTNSTRIPSRRRILSAAAGVFALAVGAAGCSQVMSGSDSGAGSALSARLSSATEQVMVVAGNTPSSVSIGVSRALFTTAPVVVVARDDATARTGARDAARLGVPMLLLPDHGPVTSVTDEITRLKPKTILAVGNSVMVTLKRHTATSIVTSAGDLPDVSRATPVASTTVLTAQHDDAAETAESAAVRATSTAAGARTVAVRGGDLRSDPSAIEALSDHHPGRVIGAGSAFGPKAQLQQRLAVAETGVQLPGGGQKFFPGRRLVALYGHPGTGALGVLGEQDVDASIARARKLAKEYQPLSAVPVVPTFEIIATIADSVPGPDDDYSNESSVESLRPWVEKAGKAGMYVVLDLQPGRANLLDQAKRYAPLLKLPYVGLALDPEWKLQPGQLPMQQIGGADSSEINSVSAWLSHLTTKHKLPQKLLVLHQFQLSMIGNEDKLRTDDDNVQVLIHMDGQGSQPAKDATWANVKNAAPVQGLPFGWKNFYDEDQPMLSPQETMQKKPAPLMISYQ